MAAVAEASGRAFAATWRDQRGKVVATTYAGTMCLWPRLPWRLRFSGEGFEGVIPCRECPGCLEFERSRLAERLHAKYGNHSPGRGGQPRARSEGSARFRLSPANHLFVVRIWAPIELHASMAHRLHRRRGLQLEPGMWRLGSNSFALIAREPNPSRVVLRAMGLRHRIEPLRLRRGRRAWRPLTAGLLVAREVYGEQRNRFYARGLPPADRQKWEVQKVAKYESYDRARSPRAFKSGGVVLVPPDVWRLCRTDRRALRGLLSRQSDPEGVRKVMGLVADTISKARSGFTVSAPAKPVLSREQVVDWYARNAERSKLRTIVTESDQIIPPLSDAGGYTSSEHRQGELMPRELERERRQAWLDAKKRRAVKESMEIIERMKVKAKGRGENST